MISTTVLWQASMMSKTLYFVVAPLSSATRIVQAGIDTIESDYVIENDSSLEKLP